MNNFNNQSWQPNQNWSSMYQTPFTTNVVHVTSPEEALMRTNQRNSEAVYFNQDKPEFYRVRVDNEGRKMWQPFTYGAPNPDLTMPATKADIIAISERLQKLETRFEPTTTEVNKDAESHG